MRTPQLFEISVVSNGKVENLGVDSLVGIARIARRITLGHSMGEEAGKWIEMLSCY